MRSRNKSSYFFSLVESNTEFDFDGLRLDWIRLQVLMTIEAYIMSCILLYIHLSSYIFRPTQASVELHQKSKTSVTWQYY